MFTCRRCGKSFKTIRKCNDHFRICETPKKIIRIETYDGTAEHFGERVCNLDLFGERIHDDLIEQVEKFLTEKGWIRPRP